jgi:hypothetical protein
MTGERCPGHAANEASREDLLPPLWLFSRLIRCHADNVL